MLELDFGLQGSDEQRIYASPNYITLGGAPINETFNDLEVYNTDKIFEVHAYCMLDKVIAFDETSGSFFSEY